MADWLSEWEKTREEIECRKFKDLPHFYLEFSVTKPNEPFRIKYDEENSFNSIEKSSEGIYYFFDKTKTPHVIIEDRKLKKHLQLKIGGDIVIFSKEITSTLLEGSGGARRRYYQLLQLHKTHCGQFSIAKIFLLPRQLALFPSDDQNNLNESFDIPEYVIVR